MDELHQSDSSSAFKGRGTRRSPAALSIAGACIFFAILWAFDFPKPYVDDLFYCGAALNLAGGGDFSNPLLAGQGFHHYFFVYPPLESYAMFGWLKLFGISAASMTGFAILTYVVISVATIAILRRHAVAHWLEWAVPLAVGAAFLRTGGLRPEPLAIALIMSGAALFECGCRNKAAVFPGFLLLFVGGSGAPRMTPFALVFLWLAARQLWRETSGDSRRRWIYLALALVAATLTVLLFLLMIQFRLWEFLETFRTHSRRMATLATSLRMLFFDVMGVLTWPLLALPVVLAFMSRRWPWDGLKVMAAYIGITFFVIGCAGVNGSGSIWFAILTGLLLTGHCLKRLTGWQAAAVTAGALLAMVMGNGRPLVEFVGTVTGNIRLARGGQQAAALAARPTDGHRVIVDIYVARYLFDYRIPPGLLAYEYAAPFPKTTILEDYRKSDIYLAGPVTVDKLRERTWLSQDAPPKWNPIGPNRWSFAKNPAWVYVIPAENCQGVRP